MFAVMIGNDPTDAIKVKRTISLLQDIITIADTDMARLAGISHDLPDIQDLLTWYQDIDGIFHSVQYADTEV